MNVEARLGQLVGPVAGRLHTGRSRNDQVATDLALYLRVPRSRRPWNIELRRVLLARAQGISTRCCPATRISSVRSRVRLAYWLAFVEMLARDAGRFADRARLVAPLGAGAIAGSTFLSIANTRRALADGPTRNSMDSVASRDLALELLAASAICMVTLTPGGGTRALVHRRVQLHRVGRRLTGST
jgi:argininosuccinate lyase